MCHERSTAERHYRHHMSHRYLSSVFTELGKCQTHPEVATCDEIDKLKSIAHCSLSEDVISSSSNNHSGTEHLDSPVIESENSDSIVTENTMQPLENSSPKSSGTFQEEFPFKSKYSRKRNGKSIFPN